MKDVSRHMKKLNRQVVRSVQREKTQSPPLSPPLNSPPEKIAKPSRRKPLFTRPSFRP